MLQSPIRYLQPALVSQISPKSTLSRYLGGGLSRRIPEFCHTTLYNCSQPCAGAILPRFLPCILYPDITKFYRTATEFFRADTHANTLCTTAYQITGGQSTSFPHPRHPRCRSIGMTRKLRIVSFLRLLRRTTTRYVRRNSPPTPVLLSSIATILPITPNPHTY